MSQVRFLGALALPLLCAVLAWGRRSGASIHLTPNGDAVFLYTDKGELIQAQLTAKEYKEISRVRLVEPTGTQKVAWAHPAYANRHVFVRNDKELLCLSLAKP